MKSFALNSPVKLVGCGVLSALAGLALSAALLLSPAPACAQSDDFNDGNDDGWTRYDPLGSPPLPFGPQAVFSFPNGAYRIQTPPSPSPGLPPANPNGVGPGRAGAVLTAVPYTDFYVSVDVLDWNPQPDQAFGILARVSNPGLQSLNCYAFTWETGNDLDVTVVQGEVPLRQIETDNSNITLNTNKDYRFVFIGKGQNFEARVYELPNVLTPIKSVTGTDASYSSGWVGLVVYDNSDGQNGITDATFDNFVALPVEPPKLSHNYWPSFGELEVTWRQDAGPFRLQGTTGLPAASWQDITTDIQDVWPNWIYIEDVTQPGSKRFFRLIQD